MHRHHGWLSENSREFGISQPGNSGWPRENEEPDWYLGENFKRYPNRQLLLDADFDTWLKGWMPSEPIIYPQSRVLALGSCFASNFVEWLDRHGFNKLNMEASRALLRNPFENTAVVEQLFRWAFAELDPTTLVWVGRDRRRIAPTEEHRLALRSALTEADVLIVTLSLSELWYDKLTGEPLWRMPKELHDPERHGFKVLSVAETLLTLESIERIRRSYMPNLRIIYTVSPMPLAATFRPVSSLTANSASKAVVRASVDEFLRSREDLNRTYFYYPGYEIVTEMIADPFLPDNRHLHDFVIDAVMDQFARGFMAGDTHDKNSPKLKQVMTGDPHHVELERKIADLWRVCGERLVVIQGLAKTCADRLEVIGGLKKACDERLALINQLQKTCEDRLAVIDGIERSRAVGSDP
jgi:hypothetical protein